MSETLVAAQNETFPNRRHWTVEQCYRLIEIGELTGRWELIDGEILSKMGQKPAHSFTLILVAEWLVALFGFRQTRTQLPIRIPGQTGDTSEPEPDIAVITAEASMHHDRIPGSTDVLLIVEIADTSLIFDLNTKAALYARSGVPEYWVVDIVSRQLHRHRSPSFAGYSDVSVLVETELISPELRADAAIAVVLLLPPLSGA